MNQNENKYDDTEYVFVEFEAQGREKGCCDMNVKQKRSELDKLVRFSSAVQNVETQRDCDDDFSLSSFDLCDEELAIDTSDAEIQDEERPLIDIGNDDDDESLHLSQSPSVASVCTETMFETMKDQDIKCTTAPSFSNSNAADHDNFESKGSSDAATKKSRARSESNANSTASSSTAHGTSVNTTSSRLSNKKRRKKIKQQKKAAAAAAAADALVASQSRQKQTTTTVSPALCTVPKTHKKCNATSIAVLCATQSLTQYRQEIGLLNVNNQGHTSGLKPHTMTANDSHALNLIRSI